MRITAAQLRTVIRSILLREALDAEQTAASPAADQAHKQLESQPVDDTNLMVKGDAAYTAFIRQHPKAQAGLDSIFAMFETARQNRLEYLRTSFAERYEALQKKLNTGTNVDVEKLKQAMISRVEKSQIKMGTYGSVIKPNYENIYYIVKKDETSGWIKDLSNAGFSDTSGPYGYNIAAYAPQAAELVVIAPPDLKFSATGEVEAAIPNEHVLSTLKHELIHQEDHAADALLGIQPGMIKSGIGGAAEFSARLIRQAMVPSDQLTLDFIYSRLGNNKMSINVLQTASDAGFDLNETFTLFPSAAFVIASYAKKLNNYPRDTYAIFYYTLERSLGKKIAEIETGSEELKKINVILEQSSRKQGYDLTQKFLDYQLDTHLRIVLSQMLPHLQKALAENTDPEAVIEATLTSMESANLGSSLTRAAFILAITDPKKLADLTMVALGGSKQKGAPGRPEDQTALAENVRRRWSRIAGLV